MTTRRSASSSTLRAVAKRFGTEHTEVMIRPVGPEDVERGVWHLDEPMTDLSAIPLMLLCQRVRQDVIVCLSGEGGDEVFVGYDRFRASRFSAQIYERLPRSLRRALIEPFVRRLPDQEQKKGAVNIVKRFVDGARLDPAGEHMRWQYFLSPELATGLFRGEFLSSIDVGSLCARRAVGATPARRRTGSIARSTSTSR